MASTEGKTGNTGGTPGVFFNNEHNTAQTSRNLMGSPISTPARRDISAPPSKPLSPSVTSIPSQPEMPQAPIEKPVIQTQSPSVPRVAEEAVDPREGWSQDHKTVAAILDRSPFALTTEAKQKAREKYREESVNFGNKYAHLLNRRDVRQNGLLLALYGRMVAPEIKSALLKSLERNIAYQQHVSKLRERPLPHRARERMRDSYRTNVTGQQAFRITHPNEFPQQASAEHRKQAWDLHSQKSAQQPQQKAQLTWRERLANFNLNYKTWKKNKQRKILLKEKIKQARQTIKNVEDSQIKKAARQTIKTAKAEMKNLKGFIKTISGTPHS